MSSLNVNVNFNIDNFPFEIIDLDREINQKMKNHFTGNKENRILVGPKKYCLLEKYKELGPIFYNFPIRSNDVWLLGFRRSGTTLTQEIIWLICNDLNYEKAEKTHMGLRFPFFEMLMMQSPVISEVNKHYPSSKNVDQEIISLMKKFSTPSLQRLMETKERRFIKTHLPISLINPDIFKKGCKVIYIMRNPKDVFVSTYYFDKTMKYTLFDGNLEDYWEYFRQNLCRWCPYYEHIKEGWQIRYNPNVLFLFYEEILQDMRKTLIKIANFLEKPLEDQQIDKLENHLKIHNFRKNNSVNGNFARKLGIMEDKDDAFIRKGKINGWKDYFTEKMNDEFDKWFEENMKGCDLKLFE